MLDEIKNLVEVSKQVLDTLPKNNIKNSKKYEEVLEQQASKYENYKSEIEKEMLKRVKKYTDFKEDFELIEQETQIAFIKENLFLLNHYNSSYEKFNLDKMLYKLNRFYKEDLTEVNSNILQCINIFERVGVKLTSDDFNYSEFSNKYMKVLLENKDDELKVKETFENIYWQCSDLLIHIELNFKYLYYLNQKEFDKYSEILKNKFINVYDNKDIIDNYKTLVIDYDLSKSSSPNLNLNKFLNKELNISDYQESKIERCYQYFTDYYQDIKVNEEIFKMANSVKEYKGYIYFKYIIDDIKKLYSEKDKYKDLSKNKLKQIQKQEKLLFAYNKKSKRRFSSNRINIKINNLINELEILYKELDEDIFCEAIYKNLTDESSIYDALCLAASYYSYIVKCMKQEEKEGEFFLEQQKLIQYILNPYNNLIENISIIEEKDIPLIICDRFKLSNFHIDKEMIDENGINELIDNATKIEIYAKFVSKVTYENLKFILEAKDIFNK